MTYTGCGKYMDLVVPGNDHFKKQCGPIVNNLSQTELGVWVGVTYYGFGVNNLVSLNLSLLVIYLNIAENKTWPLG